MPDSWEIVKLGIAAGLGAVLAGVYFGGLWLTVRRLPRARHPWLLYVMSLLIRLAGVLLCLYVTLIWFDWPALAAVLVGFLLLRVVLSRLLLGSAAVRSEPREVL